MSDFVRSDGGAVARVAGGGGVVYHRKSTFACADEELMTSDRRHHERHILAVGNMVDGSELEGGFLHRQAVKPRLLPRQDGLAAKFDGFGGSDHGDGVTAYGVHHGTGSDVVATYDLDFVYSGDRMTGHDGY